MDPQTYALIGVSITLGLFLLGGAFGLGRLFQRVESLDRRVDTLSDDVRQLTTEVRKLTGEVRRTNETVVALANHRHDVDGNTVFTVPGGDDD